MRNVNPYDQPRAAGFIISIRRKNVPLNKSIYKIPTDISY